MITRVLSVRRVTQPGESAELGARLQVFDIVSRLFDELVPDEKEKLIRVNGC